MIDFIKDFVAWHDKVYFKDFEEVYDLYFVVKYPFIQNKRGRFVCVKENGRPNNTYYVNFSEVENTLMLPSDGARLLFLAFLREQHCDQGFDMEMQRCYFKERMGLQKYLTCKR